MTTHKAPVPVGETFAEQVTFDADSIRTFATLSGDMNPLHHDDAAGAASPFGRIIASGPHVVSRMLGLDATFFSARATALGLHFDFRFVRAIPAGTTLTLEWRVTSCVHKASLDGFVAHVEGRAFDADGVVYTTGHGANLLRPLPTGASAP